MPCIYILGSLLAPRILIVILWLLTDWFRGVFDLVLWPILGFIFLPTTLLWYVAVENWFHGDWGIVPIVGIVIALWIDVWLVKGKRRRKSRKKDLAPN